MSSIAVLRQKFKSIWRLMDERTRRIMAANEAIGLGYGGVSLVHRACGLSRKAIAKGIGEIEVGDSSLAGRIRRPGAGRKNLTVSDPALLAALDGLINRHLQIIHLRRKLHHAVLVRTSRMRRAQRAQRMWTFSRL